MVTKAKKAKSVVKRRVAKAPAARKKPPALKKKTAAKRRAAPARKGAVAREVHKVSPNRGMPINDWIANRATGWQGEAIRQMIAVVRAAAPESVVSIKWNQPVFEQNGPFAFIMVAKAHVSFGFWRGSEVVDPTGILERGDRMGHFKLTAPEQLDVGALAVMVQDAVRLNQEKGSPTIRG